MKKKLPYHITQSQYANARELGVYIRPPTNPNKKIDVYRAGKKVAEIGARGYMDFELWKQFKGEDYAKERRRLYKIRHEKNRNVKNTPGYYADRILW